MTTWSVSIDATVSEPVDDLADVVDELLSILENRTDVIAPVTFVNVRDQTFGARLTVQAKDMLTAISHAIEVFRSSSETSGLSLVLQGGNIVSDDALSVDEPEHSLANV